MLILDGSVDDDDRRRDAGAARGRRLRRQPRRRARAPLGGRRHVHRGARARAARPHPGSASATSCSATSRARCTSSARLRWRRSRSCTASWHGAWCWERLEPELDARGHRAVAVDLPIEDPDAGLTPARRARRRGAPRGRRRRDPRRSLDGGSTIPLVARHRPLRHLVFLAALLPEPGRSVTDRYTTEDVYVPGFVGNTRLRDDGASYWPDPEAAVRCFYHDCADHGRGVGRLPAAPPVRGPATRAVAPRRAAGRRTHLDRLSRRARHRAGVVADDVARASRGRADRARRRSLALPLATRRAGRPPGPPGVTDHAPPGPGQGYRREP